MATQTYTLLAPGTYADQTIDLGQATQNKSSNVKTVRVYWQSPDGMAAGASCEVNFEQSSSRQGPWTNPVTTSSPGYFFGGVFAPGIDKQTGLPRTGGEIRTDLAAIEQGTRTYHGTCTITGTLTNFGLYIDLIS